MFQSNSYPIISKGAYSKNYKIEKLSKWTDCDILYDSVNNYFLVCFNKDLIKLPTKFKESSGVSFIRVSRRNSSFAKSDFTGLYIIKKK